MCPSRVYTACLVCRALANVGSSPVLLHPAVPKSTESGFRILHGLYTRTQTFRPCTCTFDRNMNGNDISTRLVPGVFETLPNLHQLWDMYLWYVLCGASQSQVQTVICAQHVSTHTLVCAWVEICKCMYKAHIHTYKAWNRTGNGTYTYWLYYNTGRQKRAGNVRRLQCANVCVYINICTRGHVHVYTHTWTHLNATRVTAYTCMHHTHTCAHTHTCTHTSIPALTLQYLYIYIYMYIYIYICIYIYIHNTMHMCACRCTFMYIYIYIYICVHVYRLFRSGDVGCCVTICNLYLWSYGSVHMQASVHWLVMHVCIHM